MDRMDVELGVDGGRVRETAAKRARRKRVLLGPAILAVTMALSFGILEIAVRLFVDDGMNFNLEMWKYARDLKQKSADPLIGHEHRPNTRSHLMGVDVQINAHGYRDREIPVERRPGVPRIALLGDSFIEGWGVPLADTVAKRLEQLFREAGRDVEVMNMGVGNYATVMEVQAFLTRGTKFQPDLVVLNYTFNDAEPIPSYQSTNFFARNSQAAVFLVAGFDMLFRIAGTKRQWDEYYLDLYETPGWPAVKQAVHRLAEDCRQKRVGLMLVNWPELRDPRNYRLEAITRRVRAVADEANVPFVDLLPAVKNEDPATLWVTPPDPHPNARANALYANYLFPIVSEQLATAAARPALAAE